ncbi:helix-turn-helix transcriptional regulator [Methanobacterium sp. CWC-01]|nr:helix-turn-helix transcriptional regulator [Methanobacterium sp. CWC-01]
MDDMYYSDTMISRMQLKKEKKKKTILDAAEKIVAERGMAGMTMGQVALEADVATGTLYLYFKNKGSLLAAVNARLNREVNQYMQEKMSIYRTGSEKVRAMGDATVEYFFANPQKWKAVTELYQMKVQDPEDPNVQDFLQVTNEMVQIMAQAYQQGIQEETIRKDLDPVATAIYNRMAFGNAFTPTTEQKMLLELNRITPERYLMVASGLIVRSTHKTLPADQQVKKS